MEFSRQEYWSGVPFPTPWDLPDPGMETASPVSPAFGGGFFTLCHLGSLKAIMVVVVGGLVPKSYLVLVIPWTVTC